MIETNNIGVEVNGHFILKNVDAKFHAGEISVILGPNGAGKTTLLKCLTGTLRPSTGSVTLGGQQLSDYTLGELAKRRAVLSQSTSIQFPFTADEIVLMGRNPHITKHPAAKDHAIIDEVLDYLDAYPLRKQIFPTLSGGEQQRIHIARVLTQIWEEENACLFLDEPTAALDLKHQHEALALMKRLAKEKNWAVVMVVHDLHLAKMYGDKALLIKDGKVVMDNTIEQALIAENISQLFDIAPELVPH